MLATQEGPLTCQAPLTHDAVAEPLAPAFVLVSANELPTAVMGALPVQ